MLCLYPLIRMTSGGTEDSVATVPVPIARKMKLDQQVRKMHGYFVHNTVLQQLFALLLLTPREQ